MSSESVQSLIVEATKFNPVKVKYTKMKINKVGGKSVGIMNSETGKSLIIQTPLILTWGANKFVDEKSGKETYDMSLQFPNDDYQTEDNRKFLEAMTSFQSKLKEDAVTNSKEWFNKPKMSMEVIDALFHPMLSYSKDKTTGEIDTTKSPTLKVKIPYWEDQFNCEIYDTNSKMLFPNETSNVTPTELITKASTVAVVMQCGGLWFANGKCGVTWKLVQCIVKPKPTLKGRCLISLTPESKTQIEQSSSPAASQSAASREESVSMRIAEDSEDEGEHEAAPTETLQSSVVEPEQVASVASPAAVTLVKKEVKRIVKKKD